MRIVRVTRGKRLSNIQIQNLTITYNHRVYHCCANFTCDCDKW